MNTPSVLGKSFVEAQFIMGGATLLVRGASTVGNIPGIIPTLVLQGGSGSTPMLTADSTLITADGYMTVDSVPALLTAPYVLSQSPPPGTQPTVAQYVAIGYPIPTPRGTIPVP